MYTKEDMEKCFRAGVKFERDMFNNPSNSEYMLIVEEQQEKIGREKSKNKASCKNCWHNCKRNGMRGNYMPCANCNESLSEWERIFKD